MTSPKIRFKDEKGDSFPNWNFEQIGNITEIVGGGTPSTSITEYWNGPIQWLTPTEINSKYVHASERTITFDGLSNSSAKLLPTGALLLTTRATIGACSINNFDGPICTNQGFQSLICKNSIHNEFAYYAITFDSFQRNLVKHSSGSTFLEISPKNLKKLVLPVPDIREQEKIASFFSAIDRKIALAERKLDNIYKLRDLLLEELLNQGIRFIGASGKHFPDWKSVTISDVSTDLSYGINAAATKFDGKHRYIRITDIDDKTHEYLSDNPVSPDKIPDSKYKLKVGDILFARTGNSVGKSYIYKVEDGDLYYAGFLIRARIREEVNPYFIYLNTLTKHYSKWVSTSSQRSGQPGINSQQYGSYVLSLPCKTEQDRIADFMLGIESKISNLKRKAYTLHQLKKALLQQMFV